MPIDRNWRNVLSIIKCASTEMFVSLLALLFFLKIRLGANRTIFDLCYVYIHNYVYAPNYILYRCDL